MPHKLKHNPKMNAENNHPEVYTVRAYAPGQTHEHAERKSGTPYAFGVWTQSIAKGYEGAWIFCGFASDAKKAVALARKESGTIVPTVIL